ncbi:inactive ubiquitin carboxyl-terminal hydrolase 50 isoform X2 [Erinaceus europaeus]|uniref:ubiquitinyl hydrolase 1 n=1 Tax=Erinaceus europaeus TaxID=9365 RepID=A0ABM3W229_ERIEU|nr:inactive ubiquitin carboxyl-terminal hydrolase 50 isoform X2 [Erinaceus europaeus]
MQDQRGSTKMTSQRPFPVDDFSIYYILFADNEAEKNQPHFQGVTGLRNLGNTCYMNAILQCLCSISPLVEYFLSGTYMTALQKDCSEVATAFAYVMTDMWLGDSGCVSPEIFRSALGSLYPAFMKKTQQDAQEFLIYVLNELHEALKRYQRRRSYEKGSALRCSRKMVTSESSIITRLFEGQLSYSIMCLKCENCTYKNEVFTVLSLPIPSEYECSLQDCLQCFFQQDTLTWNNQIHCSFCKTKRETAVRASISKAPKIIIFHLKRTTLVIWMVGTTLLSARTQLPRPGTALMTQESVRFQTLQFKLLQPISCFTAANPFPYLYTNAGARRRVFPENCKQMQPETGSKFCFVIKLVQLISLERSLSAMIHIIHILFTRQVMYQRKWGLAHWKRQHGQNAVLLKRGRFYIEFRPEFSINFSVFLIIKSH